MTCYTLIVVKERQIILIGGAPTAGKSTVAGLVAKYLGIPWISTDQIREIMRTIANRNEYPKFFDPEGYTAERFLTEFSSEEIVNMELSQGEITWIAVKSLIENDYTWEKGFVIEGISILPHLVDKDFKGSNSVKAVFLVDEDLDRIRDVVFNRGLWDDADKYSDTVKEKEVEWALLFGKKLKSEASKYGFPCVEVCKDKNDLHAVLKALDLK